MLKALIESIRHQIMIVALFPSLFLMIFFPFNLPFNAFFLGMAVVLSIMIIFWLIRLSGFQEAVSLKEEVVDLEDELQHVKNEQAAYQVNAENYSLTWVHQIKAPITASKPPLERNEDNTVNRIRQEIIQIDNHTSLVPGYLKLMNQETDMPLSEVTTNDLVKPLIMKYPIQFIDQKTTIHYTRCEDEVPTNVQWCTIIIERILNNALKYARGKDIWVTFNNENHVLSIRNNGVGIGKADLPKIFDKGYSGYSGRLYQHSSDIGLFIVEHISAYLRHKVEISSTFHEETTSDIYLPENS